uniref:Putative secreted peptide n=1 Tax=Anopheles braziliensis TaxID=58242 RepID=A0A2M3ZQ44_9DIPT
MNRRSGLHRVVSIVLRSLLFFALLGAFTLLLRHPGVQIFLMVSRWGPSLIHRVGRAADGGHGSIAQRPVLDRWILFFENVREHLYAGTRRRGMLLLLLARVRRSGRLLLMLLCLNALS